MKKILIYICRALGYEVKKINTSERTKKSNIAKSQDELEISRKHKIVDIDSLAEFSQTIPGMISCESGKMLYTLCFMQQINGDVVEVGSWQGRSTVFLASAVKNSGNGKMYAIDHFKGNIGKEKFYIVNKNDLSDLKEGFLNNIKKAGLSQDVTLFDMDSEQAAKQLHNKIRFLFIDGDHTKSGVEKDIELFFPKLSEGSIIVFDDFSNNFPGLIDTVNDLLLVKKFARIMSYKNTLVLQI